jgi:hypothetical protein
MALVNCDTEVLIISDDDPMDFVTKRLGDCTSAELAAKLAEWRRHAAKAQNEVIKLEFLIAKRQTP